ncbi:MAG: hypothetical protein H6R01_625 [Burkholderiaceae bacterium]|nr:hypothetical protein [Burkholderiaceae bacterium]
MNSPSADTTPLILFGAFDRHNFGDLLFPHIAAALLPDKNLLFAGLAERDLRAYGGHRVAALPGLLDELGGQKADLMHVGGEILTCSAWEAAAMLLPPETAQRTIVRLDARPQERPAWTREALRTDALAPYCVSRTRRKQINRVIFNAVGGVALDEIPASMRAEVLANLRAADAIGVRERHTLAHLSSAGITAHLMPDPAVMVAELFGDRIRQRCIQAEVAQIRQRFPHGYLAVQFSANFGDDATLSAIAAKLDQASAENGLGIVFFRAGAATWHDDLDVYRRCAARMTTTATAIFESLHLWDICALIAASRGFCGSSLHGRIVATAFALPHVSLLADESLPHASKQAAYASAWEPLAMIGMTGTRHLATQLAQALAANPELLRQTADRLAAEYRQGFSAQYAVLSA